jgi:lysozyme
MAGAMRLPLFLVFLGACGEPPIGVGSSEAAQKVCAKGATTKGIDVSHWDGDIDWTAVKAAGIEFAFMKATEGTSFTDPQFATYWQDAQKSSVIRGAYHFFRPAVDAAQQADFFVQTAGVPQLGDLPLTLDLEVTDSLAAAEVAQAALVFLQRVEQLTGRVPIIYTSSRVFDTVLGTPSGFGSYLLWDANWNVQCPNISDPPWGEWTFWQTTDSGQLAGLTNVDLDEFNGTLQDLIDFVNPLPPAPDGAIEDGSIVDGAQEPTELGTDGSSVDGGANRDAGSPTMAGGCQCDLAARSKGSPGLILLALVAAGRLVRRSRSSAARIRS